MYKKRAVSHFRPCSLPSMWELDTLRNCLTAPSNLAYSYSLTLFSPMTIWKSLGRRCAFAISPLSLHSNSLERGSVAATKSAASSSLLLLTWKLVFCFHHAVHAANCCEWARWCHWKKEIASSSSCVVWGLSLACGASANAPRLMTNQCEADYSYTPTQHAHCI